MSNIEQEKKLLRKKMKSLRAENRGDDRTAAENLFSLPEIKDKNTFFVYNSFGSELSTMPVIRRLLAEGKKVFLPRVEGADMAAVSYNESTPMSESKYKIKEPSGQAYRGETEVVLLPLLAADAQGNRLGYGGGYYDRFLKGRNALKIGYCYDFQVLDAVCAAPHDVKLDVIVTDQRIIRIGEE